MTDRRSREETFEVLVSSVRGRRSRLLGVVGWSLVEAVPALLSGRLVALAIDHGFLAHRPAVGLAWLAALGSSVLVGGWGTRQVYPNLAALVEPLRDRLVALTVDSALRRSTRPGGHVDDAGVARLTRQVEIVREAYASVLVLVQGFVVTTVSALIGLASLAPAALLFVLPPLLIGLCIFAGSLGVLARRQRDSIIAEERISEITSQMVAARRDITASGGEKIVESEASRQIETQATATASLARLAAVRNLSVSLGGLLPVVLVLVGGGWLIKHGATTGTIVGVLTYLLSGVHPALQTLVRGLGSNGVWLLVALQRLLEATESPGADARAERSPSDARSRLSLLGPVNGHVDVRLERATFSYGSAPEPVIQDLDLLIPDGDHLVVVGPSGVGKSTLAGLISGLLETQSGDVLINGVPLQEFGSAALARLRVLIPEEAYVFSGSLRDNLTYLRKQARKAEVERAVDLLGARRLVKRVRGYRADIDPSSLSAGERQLIALVRSYLSPGRVVILDEATCHLDPMAEARVERAFARRPGTLIVVAHRISSAMRAKRILVMDGERSLLGDHEQLLATSELYRDLVGCWGSDGEAEALWALSADRQSSSSAGGRNGSRPQPSSWSSTATNGYSAGNGRGNGQRASAKR